MRLVDDGKFGYINTIEANLNLSRKYQSNQTDGNSIKEGEIGPGQPNPRDPNKREILRM